MKLPNLEKYKKQKRVKTRRWQDLAIRIIKDLACEPKHKSSIFKCCKVDMMTSQIVFNDCLELGKLSSNYFLKVYNEIRKKYEGGTSKTNIKAWIFNSKRPN